MARWGTWPEYVSVEQRKNNARRAIATLSKGSKAPSPVSVASAALPPKSMDVVMFVFFGASARIGWSNVLSTDLDTVADSVAFVTACETVKVFPERPVTV